MAQQHLQWLLGICSAPATPTSKIKYLHAGPAAAQHLGCCPSAQPDNNVLLQTMLLCTRATARIYHHGRRKGNKSSFIVDLTLCGSESLLGRIVIPLFSSAAAFLTCACIFFFARLCIEQLPQHSGMQLGDGYLLLPILHLSLNPFLCLTNNLRFTSY